MSEAFHRQSNLTTSDRYPICVTVSMSLGKVVGCNVLRPLTSSRAALRLTISYHVLLETLTPDSIIVLVPCSCRDSADEVSERSDDFNASVTQCRVLRVDLSIPGRVIESPADTPQRRSHAGYEDVHLWSVRRRERRGR